MCVCVCVCVCVYVRACACACVCVCVCVIPSSILIYQDCTRTPPVPVESAALSADAATVTVSTTTPSAASVATASPPAVLPTSPLRRTATGALVGQRFSNSIYRLKQGSDSLLTTQRHDGVADHSSSCVCLYFIASCAVHSDAHTLTTQRPTERNDGQVQQLLLQQRPVARHPLPSYRSAAQ